MSTSTMEDKLMRSPNKAHNRWMSHEEINHIFNQLVLRSYPYLKNHAFVSHLERAIQQDYGDYACKSILEICEELRNEDPNLFDRKTPKDIAQAMIHRFPIKNYQMINQQSLKVHDDGIITFSLAGSWIAERIETMLIDGINSWAPKIIYRRTARALFFSTPETRETRASTLRATCIKDAIVGMFLYSGLDVLDMGYVYPVEEEAYLKTIRDGVCRHQGDVLVYTVPRYQRESIQRNFTAAKETRWFKAERSATLTFCAYQTLDSHKQEFLDLWRAFRDDSDIPGLAKDTGYTLSKCFGGLLKYTLLKRHRLAESTFNIREMLDEEGNTFIYLLRTKTKISSLIRHSRSLRFFEPEEVLAGKGERELGLLLVQFTEGVERACKSLVPHIVCRYMFDLCKVFTSYYNEAIRAHPSKVISGLCVATEVVLDRCFLFLGINPESSWNLEKFLSGMDLKLPIRVPRVPRATDDRIIPSLSEARCSRFEMFSMSVYVNDFEEGIVFGKVSVKDAYGLRGDGLTKSDAKDCSFVSYFKFDWPNSSAFANSSCIPMGDPSCRPAVPFSSSIELHVLLHAMSEKKDRCYLLIHDKPVVPLAEFWAESPKTKCGTLKFESGVGGVHMNYILLKDAVDASMELTFDSSSNAPVKVCGSLMAYYGDNLVKDDIVGLYKAVIFKTNQSELIGKQVPLALHKSTLAVPANGSLRIEAFLMEVESKKVIVRGIKEYSARTDGADNWNIKYGNYSFNLRVAWSLDNGRRSMQRG